MAKQPLDGDRHFEKYRTETVQMDTKLGTEGEAKGVGG